MNTPDYQYVCVIAAPPERVWAGLTNPEFTCQYWHQTRVESSFKVGEEIRFLLDSGQAGAEGTILEADPPKKLSYTWNFPQNPETRDEAPSRVTFVLKKIKQGTCLTVFHDRFPPGSKMYEMVKEGWPLVIGGLKTLLESGAAVDFTAAEEK